MGSISSTTPCHRTAAVPGSGSKSRTVKAALPLAPNGTRRLAAADQSQAKRRDDLITAHMPMAVRIARSFAGRGEELEDLTQVAMLELVRAAGRFEAARGISFAHYVYPCLVGALKKYFRDNGWGVRVSRRMQELSLQTSQAIPALTQVLGRTPTVLDLAIHLRLSEKDTRDGLHSALAYRIWSLDQAAADGDDGDLGHQLGSLDSRLEAVPDRQTLAWYMADLPARQRRVVCLRFIDDLTQSEIAERLGISQMHVSRLLCRSLDALRVVLAQTWSTR